VTHSATTSRLSLPGQAGGAAGVGPTGGGAGGAAAGRGLAGGLLGGGGLAGGCEGRLAGFGALGAQRRLILLVLALDAAQRLLLLRGHLVLGWVEDRG